MTYIRDIYTKDLSLIPMKNMKNLRITAIVNCLRYIIIPTSYTHRNYSVIFIGSFLYIFEAF